MNRKHTVSITLLMCLLLAGPIISSVSAKEFNIPDEAYIIYYSSGECYVTVPMSMLNPGTPTPSTATLPSTVTLDMLLASTVDGTHGPGTSIGVNVPWGIYYIPNAYFANIPPEAITFVKALLTGFPSSLSTNTRQVGADIVTVERHGNSITAQLTQPQTFLYVFKQQSGVTAVVPITIPPFTIELNKIGGDAQIHKTSMLPSGWTQDANKIGFNAKGTITFDGQEPMAMTDCFIAMHGSTLWTPPPT